MSEILNILNEVKSTLEGDLDLSLVKFTLGFPNLCIENPLKEPNVSIGIKEININTGSFDGYLSTDDDDEYFGNLSNLKISLDIYVPEKDGGIKCFDIFYKIYKTLIDDNNPENLDFNIICFSSNEVTYDQNMGAFLLRCAVTMESFLFSK